MIRYPQFLAAPGSLSISDFTPHKPPLEPGNRGGSTSLVLLGEAQGTASEGFSTSTPRPAGVGPQHQGREELRAMQPAGCAPPLERAWALLGRSRDHRASGRVLRASRGTDRGLAFSAAVSELGRGKCLCGALPDSQSKCMELGEAEYPRHRCLCQLKSLSWFCT